MIRDEPYICLCLIDCQRVLCLLRDSPSIPLQYFHQIQPQMVNQTVVTSLWNAGNIFMDKMENMYQMGFLTNGSMDQTSEMQIVLVGIK